MTSFFNSILYSYAQIFFSNRRWFGGLILAATFIEPQIGLMALCGVILSNSIAYFLKFDAQRIETGFYGFNGLLFGAAVAFFFKLNFTLTALAAIFILVTFFITAVIEHYFATTFNLPGLSLPFIISLFIFFVFVTNFTFTSANYSFDLLRESEQSLTHYIKAYFQSLSLIILQPNFLVGIIIAVSLLLFSRVLFVLSIFSFAINLFFLNLILPNISDQILLITSFNSILTSFAIGGSLIISSRKSTFLVVFCVLMVVIITGFFYRLFYSGLFPILVLPFNFIVLLAIYSLKFRKDQTELVLLYFLPGSPEENFYYHQATKTRFENFKYLFTELPFFGEWFVSQGFEGEFTHKDSWKYAWDFVVVDDNGSEFSNSGKKLKDYYCYKLAVTAPLEGEVVKVIDGIENNEIGKVNVQKNWGNTIIIKHDNYFYSSLSHLENGSIKVKEGQKVKKGEPIALCGNSGRSPYPHLHFQFQATEKVGDKTLKFPISNYIEKIDNKNVLKNFNYPPGKSKVKNLEVNKNLKQAFDFQLGEKYKLELEINENKTVEEWEVKITAENNFYIESSTKETATFYIADKVFYFTNYHGGKKSALYYFYLLASRISFHNEVNLEWNDVYSIAQLPMKIARYCSEIVLILHSMISAKGNYRMTSGDKGEINITNEIHIMGTGLFSFLKKNFVGEISVNNNGNLNSFKVLHSQKSISAKFIN